MDTSVESVILDTIKSSNDGRSWRPTGEVMYPEFKKLSQAAGCVGYIVWLTGRHVTYYGRNGESHVEKIPPKQ